MVPNLSAIPIEGLRSLFCSLPSILGAMSGIPAEGGTNGSMEAILA
jgi:hypothetical protein